jgi:hypothetical protein
MSSTQQVLAAGPPVSIKGPWRPPGHRHLGGADFKWAIAFVLPYAAVFFAFVIYPFGYALWMASNPSLYADLIADRSYLPTLVNTLLFVGLGVNVKMFLALLLSGSSCAGAGGSGACWQSIFCLGRSRRHKRASRSTGC